MTKRQKWDVTLRFGLATLAYIAVLIGGLLVLSTAFSGAVFYVCWFTYLATVYLVFKMMTTDIIEWAFKTADDPTA